MSNVHRTWRGWIGVDFDGTLARYERGDVQLYGITYCGPPIKPMVDRVQQWGVEGREVRIVTARVWSPPREENEQRWQEARDAERAIRLWCITHLGYSLPVTCEKDFRMIELWDDRCVQVEPNTGIPYIDAVVHKRLEERKFIDSLIAKAEGYAWAGGFAEYLKAEIAKWRSEHDA